MPLRRRLLLRPRWLLLSLALLLLAGCAKQSAYTLADESILPEFLKHAPQAVRKAYRFAAANPDELAKYPCYCGCGAMGHASNLSCYISEIAGDGKVTFDNHAAGCGICVDITRDVMRLMNEGKRAPEIRQYIDATYSAFGPSSDTPFPTE